MNILGLDVESVPARYGAELARALNRALETIRLDINRRAHGVEPLIPDDWIEPEKTGDVFVAIGLSTDSMVDVVDRAKAKARSERRTA